MPIILIDGFPIDAALSEKHSFNSEATEFPVESGADLTDHIRHLPIEVDIEGVVSDTPIGDMVALRSEAAPVAPQIGPELPPDAQIPSALALAHLERIRGRRLPVTIQTNRRLYERMAMIGLDVPVDRHTGKALKFTAKFKQITLVTNQRSSIKTATPGGSGVRKLGAKPGTSKNDAPNGNTRIQWRKGRPPGATSPPYIFEQVTRVSSGDGKQFRFEHGPVSDGPDQTGKDFTNAELDAFILDMQRDQREQEAKRNLDIAQREGIVFMKPDGTVDTARSATPPAPRKS